MTPSHETEQRNEALDPTRSFIVEAPAGSGKTELLIQRYLTLLSRVERPEQIIAITFTRKAAAEMRQRVLDTLRTATAPEATVPAHRIQSIELARKVLAHAEASGWALIEQPHRLRILTIDSLNAALARRMPILSNGVVSLNVADDTSRLYALAASRTTESLADSGQLGKSLRRLLAASDNSLVQLERWLAGTLAQRDRWLRQFHATETETLVERNEANLARLSSERLAKLRQLAGKQAESQLFDLLARRHCNSSEGDAEKPHDARLWDEDQLQSAWREASKLLLTSSGSWRKRFTRKEGFPADDKSLRETLNPVLESLHAKEGLRDGLAALAALPEHPTSDAQQQLLLALEQVLPLLLAQLRVLFEEEAQVDHTELALAAQQALGAADQPSELLLALDRRIEHILVDEFQDTSHLQWRLLELLTAGWQTVDGRSLFLVGDPMQSIYRFRDADLSLFLKARHQGLAGIELQPVALSENHRSTREIVAWVNSSFAGVFPPEDAIENGIPGFRPAVSSRPPDDTSGVELHLFEAGDSRYAAEISRTIEVAQGELQRNPSGSIGILVRSRSHLVGVRAALRSAGLAAHAIEIDSLTDTQLGQDLIGMTQALLHQGDRLSWLGLLRSPCCGLEWADLFQLVGDERQLTVWERICEPECLARLSEDGRRRTEWLAERLRHSFALRPTLSLGRWLRACWLSIDGPASLSDSAELEQAERYFCELESLARNGDIDDPATIRSHFAAPRAGAEIPLESGIEIMTIHRAKGLEFDSVILPGLGRVTRGSQSNLLLNKNFELRNGERISLLAVASASREPIFELLRQIEREQDAAERGRLLYVAATRAKSRLHLIGSVDPTSVTPKTGSLLATLWPSLAPTPTPELRPRDAEQSEISLVHLPLHRLSFDGGVPEVPAGPDGPPIRAESRPDFEWVRPAAVQIGTLIHRELQRTADLAARANELLAPEVDLIRFQRELSLLGVEDEDLASAAERVADGLGKVWDDPVGRWILKPRPEAWSELRMTIRGNDRLEHIQLDRSFVDEEGQRWIIDYKTGRHLGSDVDQFLDSEVARYREQLERYARAVAQTDHRPIRVGLYFPLVNQLRDWEPMARTGSG